MTQNPKFIRCPFAEINIGDMCIAGKEGIKIGESEIQDPNTGQTYDFPPHAQVFVMVGDLKLNFAAQES